MTGKIKAALVATLAAAMFVGIFAAAVWLFTHYAMEFMSILFGTAVLVRIWLVTYRLIEDRQKKESIE